LYTSVKSVALQLAVDLALHTLLLEPDNRRLTTL
jgi:hypothetical protein